jgi:hypothetical protein
MIIMAQVSSPITPTATTPHFIQDTSRLVISVSPGGGAGGGSAVGQVAWPASDDGGRESGWQGQEKITGWLLCV